MRTKLLLVLAGLVGACAFAGDQIDSELRARDEAAKKAPKTFSWVDEKTNLEHVYNIDPATAAKLPSGDNKNLTTAQRNELEATITEIRTQKAIRVVAVNKDKDTATAAHRRYWGSRYYGPTYYSLYDAAPRYYYQPVYYYQGGGMYYDDYNYNSSWRYRGSYYYSGYSYRNCYWYN